MSAALDLILGDTASTLEVVAEIDSAHRSTGTLKTWYFSTELRSTTAAETPASTEFLPFLQFGGVLGPLSQSLSEDILFNGLAENNPGTLTLLQRVVDNDQLSDMNNYVFAGYKVRIKIGKVSDTLYSSFITFRTVTVNIDPIIQTTSSGLQAIFQLSSALKRMLDEPLIVKRYVGIPHCLRFLTATGQAIVTKVAAHDARSFTVGIKFRATAAPAVARRIFSKLVSGTNTHFFFAIQTTGKVTLTSTSNLAVDISFTSTSSICDGAWHTLIFSRDNATTAWVSIDNVDLTTYTPLGPTDLSNANLNFGLSAGGDDIDLCDARFLDRYMTSDEAQSYFATRSNGDDLNVIGLWRFDDNTGGVANDYSATNADAAISGVLNTDYSWTYTDLGEPELAGRPYPLSVGNVINARAHLIDAVRERYRGNNDSTGWFKSLSNTTLTVRSQGTVLTGGGVDYTAPTSGGDGVFNTTAAEAEPITFDHLNNGTDEEAIYPSRVAYDLLTQRTRLDYTNINNYSAESLKLLCPWPSGYYTDSDTTAQQALSEILGQCGIHYYEDNNGLIFFNSLLPPTGYGPYNEPAYDFRGMNNGISFGDVGDVSSTSSCTICGWFKVNLADQTAFLITPADPDVGRLYLLGKQDVNGNYAVYFQAVGVDAGKLIFRIAGVDLKTAAGVVTPYRWNFFACVFDNTANTMKFYLAPLGANLKEIASIANANAPVVNSLPLAITNYYGWMAVQHLQVWTSVKSVAQLNALNATPPVGNEAGLVAYIPFNERTGIPIEVVSGTVGTIFESLPPQPEWAPKLEVNLDETPSVKLTDFHHTHPASDIIIYYMKNRFQMDSADVDIGVSQNARLALTCTSLDVRLENTVLKSRFKSAKKIILDSPLTDYESALRLLRVMYARFGTDQYVGTLTFPSGLNISRLACGLTIGDEIGITGSIPSQLQTPRSFRVVSVAPNLLQLSTVVHFIG